MRAVIYIYIQLALLYIYVCMRKGAENIHWSANEFQQLVGRRHCQPGEVMHAYTWIYIQPPARAESPGKQGFFVVFLTNFHCATAIYTHHYRGGTGYHRGIPPSQMSRDAPRGRTYKITQSATKFRHWHRNKI